MGGKSNTKRLSEGAYESICRRACAAQVFAAPNETVEDVYWWHICREVHRHLNIPFSYEDVKGDSRGEVYRENLQRQVTGRQSTAFDLVAIGEKYIQQVLDGICTLHGTMMKNVVVPISYGLPPRDEELWDARAQLFPNARSYFVGGCVVDLDETETEALVCQRCREAERDWLRQNPRPNEYSLISGDR